ncbi:uncharacterized protein LOC125850936 [Solanum stenotomum]|uniref:uncharacterized protein LOC125850936 n=1 Tax=Solanum stenotomum TaxID=172797 RepID=UPI0020D07996|nr:uncharacterized protein LOC125850936 [Solanum stenotomum]
MDEEDAEKTAFTTPWGTYCYRVMPFGLKNAGATYMRAITTIFHDMMHKEVELVEEALNWNPSKIKSIRELPPPKTKTEVMSFLGRLNYISRFIGQLTATCEPIFKLLKKDTAIKWTSECQEAFDKIKEYLANPPVLVLPEPDRPLFFYLSVMDNSFGCVLGQHDITGKKEQAIYYLSKKFTSYEAKYTLLEKTCCALTWVAQKLKHYLLSYMTYLISRMDPLKYIFQKSMPTGRLAKWQILLTEFDIIYVTHTAMKAQALADHLAENPVDDKYEPLRTYFPDEEINSIEEEIPNDGHVWKLYFDGAVNKNGVGIGAVLISPNECHYLATTRLRFFSTNNTTEYEAYIMGLNMAINLDVQELVVLGDSDLLIRQARGEWETRDIKLMPYKQCLENLIKRFKSIEFRYIPRFHNELADALATLASMLPYPGNTYIDPLEIQVRDQHGYCNIIEVEPDEAETIMNEVHSGVCGPHMNGNVLAKKIIRAGCHQCQIHSDLIHSPPLELHPMSAPWPFVAWRMDVIGPIEPKASNGHRFILAAIDYFTKWVEAVTFKSVTKKAVVDFVHSNIICRFGIPKIIITDNAANLNSHLMKEVCEQFKIVHRHSTPYRPKANGVVEAANKNIKKILRRMVQGSRQWYEKLLFALLGYRTTIRTSVGATPYLLVYGIEAVIPAEVEIPSLRIIVEAEIEDTEWRMARAYNKKVRPRNFEVGQLVVKRILPHQDEAKGKFAPNWQGPYVIKQVLSKGALQLANMEGKAIDTIINADSIKSYYA